jgi:hypothetical protein
MRPLAVQAMSNNRYSKLSLNASSASTWTECTAQPHYVQQNADRIPPQDTKFSVEGTIGHAVVEAIFKKEKLPEKHDQAMIRHGQDFVDFCFDKKAPNETEHIKRTGMNDRWWSELKVDLFYMPGRNGYVDFCCIADDGIHIADYKYGQGVAVNAFENLQMAIYARSMIQQLKLTTTKQLSVHMHIFQPRVRQGEKVSSWSINYSELVQFTDDRVLGPAEDIKAKALTLTFKPSDKTCQFCPAKDFCEARTSWLLDDTPLEPLKEAEMPKLPKAASLSDEMLAHTISKASEIKKWLGTLETYGLARALEGKPLPGLKVVQSKGGHRKWGNEEKAASTLLRYCNASDVLKLSLITPKQAEEFEYDVPPTAWKDLSATIIKPEGGPVLVPEDDPRPAYMVNAADVFDDETEK